MSKVNLYLCHLTHTGLRQATEAIPLGLGYIATYLNKNFDIDMEIKIISLPEDLDELLKAQMPDLVGFANFVWNSKLSFHYARKIKGLNPHIPVFFGGPFFPKVDYLIKEQFEKYPFIDFFIPNEGEMGTGNLLQRYLDGCADLKSMKKSAIEGAIFLDDEGNLVKGKAEYLLCDLKESPSPILEGLFDHHFENSFTPMVQFIRGCPYLCTFCSEGENIPKNTRRYADGVAAREILYLEEKFQSSGVHLTIADSNFGMYQEDAEICELIKKTRARSKWPLHISVATGKANKNRLIENLTKLKGALTASLALQSGNAETLRIIKRKNFSIPQLVEIYQKISPKGLEAYCDLIIPMPKETLQSHLETFKQVADIGIMPKTFSLGLLMETELARPEVIQRYGMVKKYRLMYRCFGNYNGNFILEPEDICVGTKCFSFEDYVYARALSLMSRTFLCNRLFLELGKFILQEGLSLFDWLKAMFDSFSQGVSPLNSIMKEFMQETRDELWDSEEELCDHYSRPENIQKIREGTEGSYLVTTYVAKIVCRFYEETVDIALKKLVEQIQLKNINSDEKIYQAKEIARYLLCKNGDLLLRDADPHKTEKFNYNILKWSEEGFIKPLNHYQEVCEYLFEYTNQQQGLIISHLDRYGGDTDEGKGLIMIRLGEEMSRKIRPSNPLVL